MPFADILVPTDGSARSRRATALAVELAAEFDAELTSVYVVPAGVRHSSLRTQSRSAWQAIVHTRVPVLVCR